MKGALKYVPLDMLKYLKTKNYSLYNELNSIFNKKGCTNPLIDKDFPWLMELLPSADYREISYKEWIDIANKAISDDNLIKTIKLLKDGLIEANKDISDQTIQEYIYIKIIYETWIGYCNERAVYKFIKKLNNVKSIENVDGYTDAIHGVDFIVTTNDNRKIAIQVKPTSFLTIKQEYQDNAKLKLQKYSKLNGYEHIFVFCDHTEISSVSEKWLRDLIDNGEVEKIDFYENQRLILLWC